MQSVEDCPELYDEAVKALEKWCKDNGAIFTIPSSYDSEIGRKYVHLKNVNGPIAKYDIDRKTIVV